MSEIPAKFEKECRVIQIASIVLSRPDAIGRYNSKYQQILASIRAVGLVEAPVVFPMGGAATFGLMDGHLRLRALKELKHSQVACLIATDDDTYTYNRQISRLAPVQDAKMIAAAIKQGVSAERLAVALNITKSALKQRRALLDGVCPEAKAMLAEKDCSREIFLILKRLKPVRQIEVCELMAGQNNYTVRFARAVLVATPPEQMVTQRRKPATLSSIEQMSALEKELAALQERIQSVERTYGPDVLRFTLIKTFVAEMIGRPAVAALMRSRYPDILREFEKITQINSLPETETA